MKNILIAIGGLIIFIISSVLFFGLAFGLEWGSIKWEGYFAPKRQNVKRQVFEQTKSYTHGKIQDLAKYYEEYQKAESMEDKEAIVSLIKMNFADFDSKTIVNDTLRRFLVNIRGY